MILISYGNFVEIPWTFSGRLIFTAIFYDILNCNFERLKRYAINSEIVLDSFIATTQLFVILSKSHYNI